MDTTQNLDIDRLFALHARDVRAALRRVLGRSGEEDDLVQEAFVRLVIRMRQPGEVCVAAWLRGVAHNLAVDEVRRRRPLPVEPIHLDVPVNSHVDDELGSAELWATVVQGARGLPERQRQALAASLAPAGGVASVADRLGVSVHAAESLLSRARTGLRLHLAEAGSARGTVAVAVGTIGAAVAWLGRRGRALSVATVLTASVGTAVLLPPSYRALPSSEAMVGVTPPQVDVHAAVADRVDLAEAPATQTASPTRSTAAAVATSPSVEPGAAPVAMVGLPALPALLSALPEVPAGLATEVPAGLATAVPEAPVPCPAAGHIAGVATLPVAPCGLLPA